MCQGSLLCSPENQLLIQQKNQMMISYADIELHEQNLLDHLPRSLPDCPMFTSQNTGRLNLGYIKNAGCAL